MRNFVFGKKLPVFALTVFSASISFISCSSDTPSASNVPAAQAAPKHINYDSPQKQLTAPASPAVSAKPVVTPAANIAEESPNKVVAGTPSESDAVSHIKKKSEEYGHSNIYKVRSLRKTNGKFGGFNQNQYTLMYVIEIECLKSNEVPPPEYEEGAYQGPRITFTGNYYVSCPNKGDVRRGTGQLLFEKTENGWMAYKYPPATVSWFEESN